MLIVIYSFGGLKHSEKHFKDHDCNCNTLRPEYSKKFSFFFANIRKLLINRLFSFVSAHLGNNLINFSHRFVSIVGIVHHNPISCLLMPIVMFFLLSISFLKKFQIEETNFLYKRRK